MLGAGDDEEDEEIRNCGVDGEVFREEVEEEGVVDILLSRVTSRRKSF